VSRAAGKAPHHAHLIAGKRDMLKKGSTHLSHDRLGFYRMVMRCTCFPGVASWRHPEDNQTNSAYTI
jgi:hypothetical protein